MSRETYTSDYSRAECPYCGETNDMSESVGSRGEDLTEYDCGTCGKKFNVYVHISISVTCRAARPTEGETK